ncbi:MAG: hypothetical protein A2W25_08785 [candidate division Zixibacteria bacterium RBG_16_53_22]|nr:MAG: hypothetical protein A2W25_08785 [candidate division Zixibacteria bacterium RBG_16_53_22]
MNVAITGASGFIGSHLVPAMEEYGWNVTAITEPGDPAGGGNIRTIQADIVSATGLIEALSSADAVVHLAARNHVLRETEKDPLAEYRRVNVEGTRNVVRGAARSGARVFVLASSVKVMGEGTENVLDETAPCSPSTPYGISKRESEEVVNAETNGTEMSSIVLRLPMVYGPGNKGNLPRMIRWADRGYPFPIFQPDNLRSMAYVGNVVAGIMAILNASPQGSTTYILKDRQDYSTRMIYGEICDALGKKPHYFPVPSLAVRLGGLLSEDFRKITGSFRVNSAKFEEDFHFTSPFSLEEGIARTVQWYKRSVQLRSA